MRKLVLTLIAALAVLAAALPLAAQDADTNFDTLLAAIEAAGLGDTLANDGPFTVFAPTDDAFAAALDALGLTAEELLADTDTLTSILTYHVIEGEVLAADVLALVEGAEDGVAEVTTLNGAPLLIAVVDGVPVINDSASVIRADVAASNGVIHAIDAVLLPPAEEAAEMTEEPTAEATEDMAAMTEEPTAEATEDMAEMTEEPTAEATEDMAAMTEEPTAEATEEPAAELGTIVDVAMGDAAFSTLVEAVVAAELAETLAGEGPFTVFAPTNDAFAAALDALGLTAEELLADTDTLTSILTYHVVEGEVLAADVVALVEGAEGGVAEVTTVNGAPLSIALDDAGNVVINDTATVVITDLEASNGVIHAIDAVLLPPAEETAEVEATEEPAAAELGTIVDVAMSDAAFSTLVEAVVAASLDETLASEGPFTVFAPTNDAFAAALDGLGLTAEELLADTELLTSVLTYHVVPGNILAADVVALVEAAEDGVVSVETVNGASISITLDDAGNVVIDDTATVTTTDLEASNGVVHVIDAVLLPPGA